MNTYRDIVDAIYNDQDAKNRTKPGMQPVRYDDRPGVTSCFVFASPDPNRQSPAYAEMEMFTRELNSRVRDLVLTRWPGWRYVPHIAHVTAAAVIDPLQEQKIPPPPNDSILWKALVGAFTEFVTSLSPFCLSFHRLHIAGNGTVVLVGSPSAASIGQLRELAFHAFKGERWWRATLPDGREVHDHSASVVIGHFEPDRLSDGAGGAVYPFPFAGVQDLFPSLPIGLQFHVDTLWLIQYTNRLIDPHNHVRRLQVVDCGARHRGGPTMRCSRRRGKPSLFQAFLPGAADLVSLCGTGVTSKQIPMTARYSHPDCSFEVTLPHGWEVADTLWDKFGKLLKRYKKAFLHPQKRNGMI